MKRSNRFDSSPYPVVEDLRPRFPRLTGFPRLTVLRRLSGSSLFRFLLVGGFGELLYLGLYALFWQLGGHNAPLAIGLSGGLCVVVNAVLHARVSFRVAISGVLLLAYGAIQLLCLGLSMALGHLLQGLGLPGLWIGVLSGLTWSATSFLLTRRSFQASRSGEGR